MQKIKKTRIEVELDEVVYQLKSPSVVDVDSYSVDIEKGEKRPVFCMIDLIVKMGLPREIALELDVNQVEQLAELIMPKKN